MSAESGATAAAPKYDLLSSAFFADPYATFRVMREEDPIYWHPLLNFWVLTRYDDIQLIGRDPRFSAERPGQLATGVSEAMLPKLMEALQFVSHWMVFRDPPRHTVLRGLLAKAFTPQVIEGLRPAIQEVVDELLDAVEEMGTMDVVRDLAFPLPAIVIAKMLGVPRDRMDDFKAWTNDIFSLFSAAIKTDSAVEACYRGTVALREFFHGLIEERRGAPTDDLLSRLITVEEQGNVLSEEELVSTCALLLVAGHETTTHLIGNAVLALTQHPDQLQKLRYDPTLIEGAVEELMRYDGAAIMFSRRATEDLEIGGVQIKANDILAGMIPAGNRDPAVFEDPDRLDITRKGAKSLGFGHGIHYCIGAALARLEAQIALKEVVARLRGLRTVFGVYDWIPSIAIHGLASLPVTFERPADTRASFDDAMGYAGPMSVRMPLGKRVPVSVPPPPPAMGQKL